MRNLAIHKKDTGKFRVRKNPVVLHPALVPGHHFRKEGRMLCTRPASQSLSQDLNVEHVFLNLVDKKEYIPDHFWGLLKNDILPLRCGLTGGGNRATHSPRRMSFLSVREISASSTRVDLSEYYRNRLEPLSQPLRCDTPPGLSFWLNLLQNTAGFVVFYFRNWDLQLLYGAFVVTGSILSKKPFRVYALRFLLPK
jgi:hypothetical protein